MDKALLLDAALAIVLLLFLPLGLLRGAIREVFGLAGVLAGTILAASWGTNWGESLADLAGLRISHSRFVVQAGLVIGAVLVVGYLGPVAARIGRPSWRTRISGVVLAGINGALLATALISIWYENLSSTSTRADIEASRIGRVLSQEGDWVLLGASIVGLLLIPAALVAGRAGRNDAAEAVASPLSASVPGGKRRRLSGGGDDGKVEPSKRAFDPNSERFGADAPHAAHTMPIRSIDSGVVMSDRAVDPHWHQAQTGEWVEVARSVSTWPAAVTPRCPGCGENLARSDAFCPRCGRQRSAVS